MENAWNLCGKINKHNLSQSENSDIITTGGLGVYGSLNYKLSEIK
jgi:hypothetical protein